MIKAVDLVKHYGDYQALKGIHLDIQPGEVYCLLGANGAGKSTTIRIFLGFTAPTSGEAFIHGISVKERAQETKRFLAYIPEVVMLYPELSGLENLRFFSEMAGFRYEEERLSAFLRHAGLQAEAFNKRLASYSKGMRQKVGIAIAMAKDARAIFMDEPTSGLDPQANADFSRIVDTLREEKRAVLMATHDIFHAVEIGTHIGIMKKGELVHQLKSSDLSAQELKQLYLEVIAT